ncbi:MAG: glutathione S-transferase family protein [Nitrospira sp.]
MTIRLHKFGEAWGIADPSPFCLKLESFLKEANVPYASVPFDPMRTLSKAPKGKLPFIELEDGTQIGDSTLIIDWLSHKQGIDADAPLDSKQRAVSLAFRRMLDEHLYWVGVYFRWLDEPGWSVIREAFFSDIPWPARPVIEMMQRRRHAAALKAQGTGRHSRDDICRLGRTDVEALSRLLADNTWFFDAPRPTLLDIWAHAFVGEIIAPPIDSPLKQATLRFGNLTDHFNRLQAKLYGHPT